MEKHLETREIERTSNSATGSRANRLRPLLPATRVAFEILSVYGSRKVLIAELELRMNERNCRGLDLKHGIAGLVRRGWVTAEGSHLHITDKGMEAITSGEGVPEVKKAKRRVNAKHTRLPAGLF